ncbi:multiple sugar transport system substrate-binding protein [Paenibacillus sp. V4I3]|uniref:ABC transporter substrate-binding protein n=1 Tax=unclassified Paenibacillus TaxID=185978 RepID=UPI00277DB411|nr:MULTISPECIES: extracellular solute-binding protein [unclassified Paenibacillus]MDQ0874456.1 multiple sugar transport system substrate-binding protein [Paenibacillus sp. V4I3]MDQ0889785.1 multiple sugar transport system substrate-binding protein [Paenibacillus sp. V4I9]
MTKKLRGITWNHTRGYVSVVAASQRYMELHTDVEITWDKRSLQHFADYPIQMLAEQYDLLIIDHPWAGFAADKNILVPLDQVLPRKFMADQAVNSVGKSHLSYNFDGYQSALAVDAATPVASYRPDLFANDGLNLPATWEDLVGLAKRGKVAFAGIPIDTLMNFYMLCYTQGEEPFFNIESVVSTDMGLKVLDQLRELTNYCTKEMLDWNPIKVMEAMSTRDDLYYCPFAYGYSNYARRGYSKYAVRSTDMVSIGGHGKLRSTLGGTGLAISVNCMQMDDALSFAMFTASADIQKTIYFESGGQPGHRDAWLDEEVNRQTQNYYKDTLPALDRAYMRPRYSGYFHFQDHAGDLVRDYIRHGGNPKEVLARMDILYRESLKENL